MEPMDESDLLFYKKDHPEHGYLSNFYGAPFVLDGKHYPTSEHYFQSKKFEGHPYENEVATASTAYKAAELGRSRQYPLRPDWEAIKDNIMLQALRAKFTQNHDLRLKLLSTGNRKLVEHTRNDAYWADGGGGGKGRNMLGILLMQVRKELSQL